MPSWPEALTRRRASTNAAAAPDTLGAGPAASPTRLQPLAPQDLMWCKLPGPEPLPTGVLSFAGRVPHSTAVAFLQDKLFAVPAFARQFIQTPAGGTAWQPVAHIDVARHLHHHQLECASHDPALFEALAHWCQAPLRAGQPPWDMTLVDCRDRSLIFVRVHHAVADGPGIMQALMSCHDDPHALPRAEALAQRLMARHQQPPAAVVDPNAGLLMRAASVGMTWATRVVVGGAQIARACQAAWGIATRRADRRTPLKAAQPVVHLRYAQVSERWPLETLKRITQAQGGGTVNDALLTVFSGALRDVLSARGAPVDHIKVRAMQTVNLPRKSHGTSNSVGLAMADLPMDVATVLGRYRQVRAIMGVFKSSLEPIVAACAMAWVTRLPQALIDFMHRRTTSQCSVFVSNVIGPVEPFVLDGHIAQNMYWFAPRFGDVGVMFPVISYNGAVQVTVQVDAALQLDPQRVAAAVQQQFERLVGAAGAA